MGLVQPGAVEAFRSCFEGRASSETLDEWLVDDVWLAPPTYLQSWRGRPAVRRLLGHAGASFDEMRYEHTWQDTDSAVLMFEAKVGDLVLRGVDILHLDADGRIVGVEIAARPPNAVQALSERMGSAIGSDPFFASGTDS